MNFILIGYRASGKTSVGEKLSGLLGLPFYDTDALIRQQTGKTVREMVLEGGWPAFRQAERAAIAGLAGEEKAVIALGGGAILDPSNVKALRPRGFFIWLQAEKETIQERLKGDRASAEQRPPLSISGNEDEEEILRRRIPLYEAMADLIVDTTGLSIEAVAEEIMAALGTRKETGPAYSGISALQNVAGAHRLENSSFKSPPTLLCKGEQGGFLKNFFRRLRGCFLSRPALLSGEKRCREIR
jgi:shikimate kinase